MNEKDDVILEYLDRIYPAAEPPAVVYENLHRCDDVLDFTQRTGGFSIDTLRNRMRRLEDVGLIDVVVKEGRYRVITEEGRQYLRGDLDVSDLETRHE